MNDVYLLASFMTPFGRFAEKSHQALSSEAFSGVVADAGLFSAERVESVYFGSCAMHLFGQSNIRGQVALSPVLREGGLPANVPIINVEGGCATGAMAFHGACQEVASGAAGLCLALGVDKTFIPDAPVKMRELFDAAVDQLEPQLWREHYRAAAEACGRAFEPVPERVMLLDVCAMEASWHLKRYGTTVRQLATIAAKNHRHGALNPKAQYRKAMSVDEVLADKPVLGPLTRAMCAPISDGAAAALICSKAFLATLPVSARARAVKVRACALAGGRYRRIDEPSVTRAAAARAYREAGLGPQQVEVAEVHDATSFAEVEATEALGLCATGGGGPLAESGATELGGALPVNLSGGLVSMGHPLAASGLAMLSEVHTQLIAVVLIPATWDVV